MSKASIFRAFTFVVEDKSLIVISKEIQEGKYKTEVEIIRNLFLQGKKEEAEALKKQLLAFTPSATFSGGRKPEFLVDYSGFVVLDIDDLTPEQLEATFEKAASSPYTFFCFRSPSNAGLKILVRVTSTAEHHKIAWAQVAAHYESLLQIPIDTSGSDVTRLCFFSYDPLAYKNINNEKFLVEIFLQKNGEQKSELPPQAVQSVTENQTDLAVLFQKVTEFTLNKQTYSVGNRNVFVHQLSCNCNRAGIPLDVALQLILNDFCYDLKEVTSSVNSAYKNNPADFGTLKTKPQAPVADESAPDDFSTQLLLSPCVPESVYKNLPKLLQQGCNAFDSPREKDIFLTGALSILGGCLTTLSGTYDRKTVFPNLFCFIVGPAASGKHSLAFAKELAQRIHNAMLLNSREMKEQYDLQIENFKAIKRTKKKGDSNPDEQPPQEPKFKVLFIPANSSSAAVINHLEQNDGIGIICETEADTMGNTFKQDWGGYSDLLRKAFHHETVSCSRRTNSVYTQIEKPRVSVALSGTPSQVAGLIESAEDGLFSRFIFYNFKVKPEWRDVSPRNKFNLTKHFEQLSTEVEVMINYLNHCNTEFDLTDAQWDFLNNQFSDWLKEVSAFISEDATGSVKRLGLIVYRIAMVLSAIRKFEDAIADEKIICEDTDFQTAFALAEVYLQHAMLMFKVLPKNEHSKLDPNKQKFYEALPSGQEFTRQQAVIIGASIGIKERTVGKYLNLLVGSFLEQPIKYGPYIKK